MYPLSGNASGVITTSLSGEFKRQRELLMTTQYAVDCINDSLLSGQGYETYNVLSQNLQNRLNYYRTKFSEGDWVANSNNVWQSGSSYDFKKYGNFFSDWGQTLYYIIYTLELDG